MTARLSPRTLDLETVLDDINEALEQELKTISLMFPECSRAKALESMIESARFLRELAIDFSKRPGIFGTIPIYERGT